MKIQRLTLYALPVLLAAYGLLLFLPVRPAAGQASVLQHYVEEGLQSNLALQQREIDLAQSRQALSEARGLFLPSLDVQARYSRSGGGRTIDFPVGDLLNPVYSTLNDLLASQGQPGPFPTIDNVQVDFLRTREQDTRFRLVQPLYEPSIRHNYRLQKHLTASQEASVEAYRRELVREIKVSYFTYLKASRVVQIYEATLALVQENERVNARLLQASSVTHDAVLRARAEVLTVEQQQAEARTDRNLARSYFNFLLNRPLDTPIEEIGPFDEGMLGDLGGYRLVQATGPALAPSNLADLQARALSARQELLQLDEAVAASQNATALARGAYLPSVNLVFDTGIQGTDYGFTDGRSYYTGSVVLRWNLFNGFQSRARVQQRRLQTHRLQIQRTELERQIQLQVQEAYDDVQVTMQRSLQAAEERVRTARQSFRLVARKYEEGLAPQVSFIDARSTLTNAQLNLNITQTDLLIRLAELEYAASL